MAEGIEEAENNSDGGSCTDDNTTKTMLGAIMPCETINSSPTSLGGGIKREFDIYPSVATAAVAATATSTTSSVSSITPNPSIASPSAISISPIPQQQHHHHHQDQQPINLKSEFHESDKDLDSSPAQSPMSCNNNNDRNSGNNNLTSLLGAQLLGAAVERQSIAPDHAKAAAAVAAAQVHMNGTMQGMLNLQKLQQNLAQLQQQSSLAGLQGLAAGLSSTAGLNSPLNLSVGSPSPISNALPGGGPFGVGGTGQMPQLILASGQLVQGVQGAQLLIPTSQGIATQTILTIPVSQQINSNEQIVQSLAALNNGAASLRNLSQLQQQHQQLSAAAVVAQSDLLNPGLFPTNVQQLLSVLQPQLFNAAAVQQQTQRNQHTESHSPHHQQLVQQQQSQQSQSSSRQSDISRQETSPKHSPARSSSSYDKQLLIDTVPSSLSISSSVAQTRNSPNYNQLSNGHGSRESRQEASSPLHHLRHRSRSPASNAMSRLAATNGEITITKSHGPLSHGSSSSASQNHHTSSAVLSQQQQQSMSSLKLSPPSSMHLSPTGSDNSSNDMLDDSPNEPTINQTNCNVVDGIDLDEIKEFAKAFKLRRLSLGLTQTQVGQALSVTEGPAYSQSAICSALAAQMYAAQLSSQQQQNMFEKLDITPKSAQKIKPVLERWMKEAEESHWNRYKSGQNHLTDFIGVEPSKKRKRRTSFTPQALELLNAHFERNTHPSGTEITGLAHQLGYEREVIRIWFCNKRQALKNTVRMMSKGIV